MVPIMCQISISFVLIKCGEETYVIMLFKGGSVENCRLRAFCPYSIDVYFIQNPFCFIEGFATYLNHLKITIEMC